MENHEGSMEEWSYPIRVAAGYGGFKGIEFHLHQPIQKHCPDKKDGLFKDNDYIDTSCQKVCLSGFSGCVDHSSVIWEQIQQAK